MEWLPLAVSIVAAMFSLMASRLLGQVSEKIDGLKLHQAELETKLWNHVTATQVHDAGFARTDEQIRSLTAAVKVAHERIDRIELKA